jgi:hypothetical protein
MGLIQTFLNAFKKGQEDAAAKNRADALEHARSDGLLGPTNESAGGAFDPQRPAPEPQSGDRVDPGNLSVEGDPEEGGETLPPS